MGSVGEGEVGVSGIGDTSGRPSFEGGRGVGVGGYVVVAGY